MKKGFLLFLCFLFTCCSSPGQKKEDCNISECICEDTCGCSSECACKK